MIRQACLAMILSAVLPCFGTVVSAEEKSATVADAPNDKTRDDFQDLICAAAIDIESPIHRLALAFVEKHQYTDPRLDAFFRDAMLNKAPRPAKTLLRRTAAVSLFAFVKIHNAEKLKLIFDLLDDEEIGFLDYLRSNPGNGSLDRYEGMSSPVNTIVKLLKLQQELPALLEEKLKAEGPKTIYYVLAAYSAPSEERKKLLLRAAKIDNNESANFAVIALDELLSREQIQAKRKSSAVKVDVAIDPKIVDVTKKIFSQYDSNGSKSLDAAEWSKMKVDPSQADSDANGEITVREYAE